MLRQGAKAPYITLRIRIPLVLQVGISIDEVGTAMHSMYDLVSSQGMEKGSDPDIQERNWSKVASSLEEAHQQAGEAAASLRRNIPLLLRTTEALNKILGQSLSWRLFTTSNDDGWWSTAATATLPKESNAEAIAALLQEKFPRIFRVR